MNKHLTELVGNRETIEEVCVRVRNSQQDFNANCYLIFCGQQLFALDVVLYTGKWK